MKKVREEVDLELYFKTLEYWVDKNGNKWDSDKYTEGEARGLSKTLINCKNCVNSMYCSNCKNCTNCVNCFDCDGCVSCENCVNCTNCENCKVCNDCTDCSCLYRYEMTRGVSV